MNALQASHLESIKRKLLEEEMLITVVQHADTVEIQYSNRQLLSNELDQPTIITCCLDGRINVLDPSLGVLKFRDFSSWVYWFDI